MWLCSGRNSVSNRRARHDASGVTRPKCGMAKASSPTTKGSSSSSTLTDVPALPVETPPAVDQVAAPAPISEPAPLPVSSAPTPAKTGVRRLTLSEARALHAAQHTAQI